MPMEIYDADIAASINFCFSYTTKCNRYLYHIAFLKTFKTFNVLPGGLKITIVPFISFVTDDIKISWRNTTNSTEKDLLEKLIFGIEYKRIWLEEMFCDELRDILEGSEADDLVDWFLKVLNYLGKQKKLDSKRKEKKLTKLFRDNPENVQSAMEYFNDFLTTYDFKHFITSFILDFDNIYILGTLKNTFKQNCSEWQDSVYIAENISDSSEQGNIEENNIAEVIDGWLKGKFVSPNVINLSTRILSKAEIYLLSKGLKFIPTSTSVRKDLIKEELECFARKLRLLWHFRNEETITISNPLKKKSTFNPKGKDTAIEL